jgi:HEAT repeat protein
VLASLHDESPDVRCVALRALAKKGNRPETLKSLVSALGDTSSEVREMAARVLARLGNASVGDALVSCLKDPEASVRSAAASALRALGWRPSTHEEAARFDIALGNTPDPVAAALPQPEASTESNTAFSRRMQAELLKERNDPARIRTLLAAAFGSDLLARVSAIHDLGQVTAPGVSQALPRLLRDPEPEVRLAAAQALVDRDDTLPAHFVGLLQDSSPDVRLVAVRFFARVPNHQVTHILLPLLADPVANVRQATATTIGFDGNSAAIEDLVVALMDEDIQVRRVAQESLERIDRNWWCSAGAVAARRRLQALLAICPTPDLERLRQLLEAIGGCESHAYLQEPSVPVTGLEVRS